MMSDARGERVAGGAIREKRHVRLLWGITLTELREELKKNIHAANDNPCRYVVCRATSHELQGFPETEPRTGEIGR